MKRLSIALTAVAALTLAACGGSDDDTTSQDAAAPAGQQQGGPGGGFPGGSGKVVEVDGSTAQVQGQDQQVAVSWSDSTTITAQVSGALSDVTKGSCVMVMPDQDADADSSDTEVTAGTVRITAATDGECSMGFGGGQGGPGGHGGTPPSGAPADGERPEMPEGGERPSDAPDGAPGRGFGAFGQVTAVSGSGFTVSSTVPGSEESTTVEVTTTDDTTFTKTESADASAIEVGVCVTSIGESDDTGAIAATTIQVSQAVDGECSTGFGGGPRRGQGDQNGSDS